MVVAHRLGIGSHENLTATAMAHPRSARGSLPKPRKSWDRERLGLIERKLVNVKPQDFPELYRDLAAAAEQHKAALVAYVEREYGWPLAEYWCVEQIMLVAVVLALDEYWNRIDQLRTKLARKVQGQASMRLAEVLGHLANYMPAGHAAIRDIALLRQQWLELKLPAPKVGPPTKLPPRLMELFITAGLSPRRARYHATDIEKRLAGVIDVDALKERREYIELLDIVLAARREMKGKSASGPLHYHLRDHGHAGKWGAITAKGLHTLTITELTKRRKAAMRGRQSDDPAADRTKGKKE